MLFCLLLVASSSLFITAFPQNPAGQMVQADGFVFDGPAAGRPNGSQRTTSTSTSTLTSTSTPTSTSTSTSTSTTTTRSTSSTTPIPERQFDTCVTSCPVTNEYNPVCGTDNIDYTNPGGLGCAQRCGKEVTLNHYGRCSTGIAG